MYRSARTFSGFSWNGDIHGDLNSVLAMCATAHVRWQQENEITYCQLWASKSRVTPLKKMTIPRVEMQAAVLGVRLSKSLQEAAVWEFQEVFHIVDAECVLAILQNNTSALKEFMGNRAGECLKSTSVEQ